LFDPPATLTSQHHQSFVSEVRPNGSDPLSLKFVSTTTMRLRFVGSKSFI